ncbi:hypothetical protein CO2235_U710007 [Cupriavidus oxalaticus]|uniref:Uncharacterized protein n=1 Tax=Cupriavidus oxalaticus TaxID=96344 RepID=A0A375FRC8_9BURK|nr:hypothetical protein CO2235_U710007 [Cupriavidus oxalaticus]
MQTLCALAGVARGEVERCHEQFTEASLGVRYAARPAVGKDPQGVGRAGCRATASAI